MALGVEVISQHGLQNVRNQCEFPVKHLREATSNWIRYLMFEACFMTSRCCIAFFRLKFTSCRVYVVLKTWKCSEWRCLKNDDGVENTLDLQNIHSLCFAQIIILSRNCRYCVICWRPDEGLLCNTLDKLHWEYQTLVYESKNS